MDNRRNEPNLKLINMEQVEIEKIDWLLYPFIPFGKVTIVQGDPGEGKTTMVLQIIAKLTKGEAVLPSDSDESDLEEKTMALESVNVIYQTAEDGLGDTIKPRLLSAGADCSRVMVIDDNDQALTMMDGKSRWADNIMIERWFRSFKYEEAYLTEYANLKEAREAIGRYIYTYNFERCPQSIGNKQPAEVYYPVMLLDAARAAA